MGFLMAINRAILICADSCLVPQLAISRLIKNLKLCHKGTENTEFLYVRPITSTTAFSVHSVTLRQFFFDFMSASVWLETSSPYAYCQIRFE